MKQILLQEEGNIKIRSMKRNLEQPDNQQLCKVEDD